MRSRLAGACAITAAVDTRGVAYIVLIRVGRARLRGEPEGDQTHCGGTEADPTHPTEPHAHEGRDGGGYADAEGKNRLHQEQRQPVQGSRARHEGEDIDGDTGDVERLPAESAAQA